MHELISCEFITSILLCRFVSQSSRHSHWHVNIVCYSYECRNVHTVSAHCDAFPFAFTQMPHKGSTHTRIVLAIEICMSCYWKGMPEGGPEGTGCSQCGICTCKQSINAVACRWIYSYLPTANIFVAQSCTNKYAACAAVAVCLMPFLAICKIFAVDWVDLVAINGPTSCSRIINWNATFVR